ncbi:MAG TPA: succinylglutamate desuccinylase/aspartoacylase family protein [Ignavibacteriaceae bacterium]|nr:succinylglutamate desuccinylase/aspartoacylase family protein [Ignavibacteriaceae bacterium]
MQKHHYTAILFLVATAVMAFIASKDFLKMYEHDKVFPSEALTKTGMLSDYLPNLKGSNGDTEVYFFDSGVQGGTTLVLGGTHPNEPSGYLTAVVLMENIKVTQGKVIVIPQACRSGFTCTDPMEALPLGYYLKSKSGDRYFSFGSRVSNWLDQWPDPEVYTHYPSGQKLSGFETRNLNRAYPGKAKGTLTERVAYAIVELIKKEKVDVAFDLHEAAPEIPIIKAIVVHEKAKDIGAMAVLNLEFEDLKYALEISPQNFRGLSHREWGDSTEVFPFLMETSNPIQGRLRGRTNADLIINGVDNNYKIALESGKLRIEYDPEGEPLSVRVARHLQGIHAVVEAFNGFYPERQIVYENVPSYSDIEANGLEVYLQ